MEFLTAEHGQRAAEFLQEIKQQLARPSQQILQELERGFSLEELLKEGMRYMKEDVATAVIIWEYALEQEHGSDKALEDGRVKDTRFVILHQFFAALVSAGPWGKAVQIAKMFFSEVSEMKDSRSPRMLSEEALLCHSFLAHIDLGTAYRLLKDLEKARELFRQSLQIAEQIKDDDKQSLAKVNLVLCLLDEGQLKQAIEEYLCPMMQHKGSMSPRIQVLYLQQYGNACRSAADWGTARRHLRDALELAKGLKDPGLVSSCCGDLGNVFRSEGRYKCAEDYHKKNMKFALKRGDVHGVAVSHGNLGFLKFYNPDEYDLSVVYQAVEYELAKEIGDFGRTGIAMNKIGKLYVTLEHNDQAVEMFKFAIKSHKLAHNIAGEGMAWGNLGTVYRALGRYDDAIQCHKIYRDNAEKRLDIGGVAIMQTQIALDCLFKNDLIAAEVAIIEALRTLETIRRQLGEDDQAKISNFEKNQSEAYNILQVLLVAQEKYKEGLVLSETARARALADLVKKRFEVEGQSADVATNSAQELSIDKDFIDATYEKILAVCRKLNTVLVLYSLIKEPNPREGSLRWVYMWVVHPSGAIHFTKTLLQGDIQTKVEVNEKFVIDLGRSLSQGPDLEQFLSRLRFDEEQLKLRDATHGPCVVKPLHDSDYLQLLHGLEESVFQRPDSGIGQLDIKLPVGVSVSGQLPLPYISNDAEVLNSKISSEEFPKKLNSEPLRKEATSYSNTSLVKHTGAVEIKENLGSSEKSSYPDEECGAIKTDETIAANHLNKDLDKTKNTKVVNLPMKPDTQTISSEIGSPHFEIRVNERVNSGHIGTGQQSSDSLSLEGPTDHLCELKPQQESSVNGDLGITSQLSPTEKPSDLVTSNQISKSCADNGIGRLNSENSQTIDALPVKDSYLQQDNHSSEQKIAETSLSVESCIKTPTCLPLNSEAMTSGGKLKEKQFQQETQSKGSQMEGTPGCPSVESTKVEAPPELFDESTSSEVPNYKAPMPSSGPLSTEAATSEDGSTETELKQESQCKAPRDENNKEAQAPQALSEVDHWKTVLSQLNRVLIEPIKGYLPSGVAGSVCRVVFIPQDFLLKVPFAALRNAENEHYLVNRFAISTCPSVQLLDLTTLRLTRLRQESSPPEQTSLLAVGNPKMPFKEIPALPAASKEVRMVKDILACPQSEVLTWSRASKKHVMALMPKYKILHFASHAIIDERSCHGDYSMRGFIVLALSDDKNCNGLLSAEEIRQMNLSAELVVLSCCETGQGKVTGDGVLGLSRAFLAAGAACVVVTLWKIDDRFTARLIEYFYRDYKVSRDASHALHTAMKRFEQEDNSLSPRHWAAFSIVGSTGKWEGH